MAVGRAEEQRSAAVGEISVKVNVGNERRRAGAMG